MKWILLSLSLLICSHSFSQSEFETEQEVIDYLVGVWNVDSLYGGWIGPHEVPTHLVADSAFMHFQFFASDVPEDPPLSVRYYFDGEFEEGSAVTIEFRETPGYAEGFWILHAESSNFFLPYVIAEDDYSPGPGDGILTLGELAADANIYYLTKCSPEFDELGTPILRQFADEDGDGYGSIDSTLMVSCQDLDGFSYEAGDCDDTNASINPNAEEIPGNDIDENCDGVALTSSIEENEMAKLEIFPNPSSEFIYFRSEEEKFEISLYTICGNLLCTYDSPAKIDIDYLPASSYIVKYVFENGKGSGVSKIVKN